MEVLYLVIIVEKNFFVNATKYLSSFQKKKGKKKYLLYTISNGRQQRSIKKEK